MNNGFDAYSRTYEDEVQASIAFSGLRHDFFLTSKVRVLADLFARTFGTRKPSLLDVGCGVGRMHPLLAPFVSNLGGTDISAASVERARLDNPDVDYRQGSPGVLPWPDASFDATLAVCVFHHVPPGERPGLLREMARVTSQGGLVVMIEHNPWNPLTRLAVARCSFDRDAVLLSHRDAASVMRDVGLPPIEDRHFLVLPFNGRGAETVERALARWPIGAQYIVAARR
ncbi:class I SAM-dependent methyltransferase [Alsobacter sp. R-9]